MRETIFADFAQLWPERFTNVTNGIAVRRWLKQANPGLAALLTEKLGSAWENDLEDLERLKWAADDAGVPPALPRASSAPTRSGWRRRSIELLGVNVDVDAMFDVQVKRIHEYKRQLLNLLYVVVRYQRISTIPTQTSCRASVIIRRQGGARLSHGESHHQADQQRRARASTPTRASATN